MEEEVKLMRLIRGSELQDFLRCRLRWKWAWVDNLKPKIPNDKLFFGQLGHKFLEVYYRNLNHARIKTAEDMAYQAMLDLYQDTDTSGMDQIQVQELWDLASKVMFNYVSHWKKEDGKIHVLATELTFGIPLNDEVAYIGTVDMIYTDEYGNLWFMDHKFTKSIEKYEKNSIMDRQISRYWWALIQLLRGNGYFLRDNQWIRARRMTDQFPEPFGFTYNIILKDYPVPPKVLKNGGLSKDKSQKTTYDLYLQAIDEQGLCMDDYQDMLDYLLLQGERFFKRVRVHRTPQEIQASIEELAETIKDMYQPRIYRNITPDCHWDCPYKDICAASMDGSNVDYLINELFKEEKDDVPAICS